MKNIKKTSLFLFAIFFIHALIAQQVSVKIITARGKKPVFADTLKNADIKGTVATANGYFRVEFTSPKFDGAFNIPLNYQGKVGVDERIQPTFLRKDAHYTGVITLKREKDNLILLTRSPKDVPEMESEISKGIWGKEKRKQKFISTFQYRAFTYDETKFVKRDFIVNVYIDFSFTVDWVAVPRKWKPENLPDPIPEKVDISAEKTTVDSSQSASDSTKAVVDSTQAAADTTKSDKKSEAGDKPQTE